MMGWNWVSLATAKEVNLRQVLEHGGAAGLRDEALLEPALSRPQNLAAYGTSDVFDLATAYAMGIISNHPFLDGNKRTGLMCALVFLGDNGWGYAAPKTETYMAVISLVQKEIDESAFARWLKDNSKKQTPVKKKTKKTSPKK